MKCPRCGVPSDVLESRPNLHVTRRRRECLNGHRFTTLEVLPTATDTRAMAATARAAAHAIARWARDMRIRRDPRPAAVIAREQGITEARVRQIRAEG